MTTYLLTNIHDDVDDYATRVHPHRDTSAPIEYDVDLDATNRVIVDPKYAAAAEHLRVAPFFVGRKMFDEPAAPDLVKANLGPVLVVAPVALWVLHLLGSGLAAVPIRDDAADMFKP